MDALSKLNDFILDLEVRIQSGTVPGISRNIVKGNQEPMGGHRFQNDLQPEVASSVY